MKKITSILFSIRTTVILLILFGAAIGVATFVENSSGTPAAKALVYNAIWFEILLGLLIANLIGMIIKTKLVQRKKWSVLLFHIAFICILIGSAITRYFGYEGIMHIREGQTSSSISTENTAVKIVAEYKGQKVEKSSQVNFSATESNQFSETLLIGGKTIRVDNELFMQNAVEMIQADEQGQPAIALFMMSGQDQSSDLTLFADEMGFGGDLSFGFAGKNDSADVIFSVVNNALFFKSKHIITKTGMVASGMIDRENAVPMEPGSLCAGTENTVFRVNKLVFMIKGFIPKASKQLSQLPPPAEKSDMTDDVAQGNDALVLRISDGNETKKVNVIKSQSETPEPVLCLLKDVKVSVSYGIMQRQIPFEIKLNKFVLDRYQGSMSPSSYASEITLTDTEMKSVRPFRIYMNNILNYRGYRFFQSSYDQDEQGTILSVNHDYWGSMVTYLGYLMMVIGMGMTLFAKNSRFRTIMNLTSQIQQKRKAGKTLLIAALLFTSSGLFAAQVGTSKDTHIEALGSLLIQDAAQGRIEPFSTFASDVLRKISKHNSYNSTSAVEVLLGMSANPSFWKNEPLIKVANPQLEKEVGAVDGYVSYNQLFDSGNGQTYRLRDVVEKAYQKNESKHNKYEKELINVDERVNICTQIYSRSFFAFFPIVGDEKGKWTASAPALSTPSMNGMPKGKTCPYNPADQKAGMGEMTGEQMNDMGATTTDPTVGDTNPHAGMDGMDQERDTPNPHSGMGAADPSMGACTRGATGSTSAMMPLADSPENMISSYFDAVNKVGETDNWTAASENLTKIKNYQKENGGANLPSESKINLEISYNNWNIFLNLALIYGIIGAILILLHFAYIFTANARLGKWVNWSIYPLAIVFIIYTTGLGLRWYIAGHAPWSNGYEAMVFVGWASSLAGLLFARKSPLAFAVTALLSAIALSVAAMSWMNPEITNLVPVLKSYWLIVHVAVITSSYGFLAMGAILGFLNLILMISRTKKNAHRIKDNIQEISYIIEMALIVGLFMLTVGTFLGGVWANESWGRYWGWDSKETWALVSVLVYAAMLHVRMIPKGNTPFVLSTMAVVGFSSVIMTFLGVNYYLSGMHSYGQGVAPTLPNSLYLVILVVLGVVLMAFRSERKFSK